MDVTVVVGTFGSLEWLDLAQECAMPSAKARGVRVVGAHGNTLAEARNAGLDEVRTEWVCFLDADDELEMGFFGPMASLADDSVDIFAPSVRYVVSGRERAPWMPQVAGHTHACTSDCLREGNWLVVGCPVRTDLVRKVGGFRDFEVYEDWDLWLRCWLAGAGILPVPQSVYRAHVRHDSRNRGTPMERRNQVHREIVAANRPDAGHRIRRTIAEDRRQFVEHGQPMTRIAP